MRHQFLSITDVAQQLGVSERTIYRLMEQQRLHPFKMGKAWRFDQSDVDDYIKVLREESAKKLEQKEDEGLIEV